jgi:ribosomal protein S15P/S13E
MTAKHNKKRNVGIIYELLIQYITNSIIEGDRRSAKKATQIIEKRFAKNTELYKEFRLFKALANSTVNDTHVVASILAEAKRAARNINSEKLNKEKSRLIRDINYILEKQDFFYQSVPNYRNLGAIQISLNEWRKDSPDLGILIEFEKKVGENLLSEKPSQNIEKMKNELDASQSDKLVLKIMTEKINQKYAHLTKEERDIISHYAFYSSQENTDKLKDYLLEKKANALTLLEDFEDLETNRILIEKVDRVRSAINTLDENKINDISIVKFLTVTKLIGELSKKEEVNV